MWEVLVCRRLHCALQGICPWWASCVVQTTNSSPLRHQALPCALLILGVLAVKGGHADVPYNDRASVLQAWGHSETLSHNKCLWPLDHYCCPNCINTSMHHNISCLPTCHHLWSNTGFAKFFSANVRKLKVVRKSRDFGLFHFQPGLNLATLLWSYDLLVGQKLVYY